MLVHKPRLNYAHVIDFKSLKIRVTKEWNCNFRLFQFHTSMCFFPILLQIKF
jgi:hypothetical protein